METPTIANINFRIKSLKYILTNLNRVIENEVKHYTRSLDAESDSKESSENCSNNAARERGVVSAFTEGDF